MLKNISVLEGVRLLKKANQKNIHGGLSPGCPVQHNTGCFSGPFYCNIHNLPICSPLDSNH
ncbi:hypothetical protein [uncultured Kordia sp.]|uniref:hypothetical protein n=1 Tax=uncultured Kordia sp. TaxID=507699 RepID=UPI0026139F93|nr:hypothetical protein [uncultured Kordia sp.]